MKSKQKQKKITKVCDLTYAYARKGGITTYIDCKSRYYQEHGIRQIIISPRQDKIKSVKKKVHGSVTTYHVPSRSFMVEGLEYYFFAHARDIEKILLQEKPEILEIGDSFTTYFYGRRLRKIAQHINCSIVTFVHERLDHFYQQVFGVHKAGVLTRPFRRLGAHILTTLLLHRFIQTADAIIANSDFSAQETRAHTKKRIYVLALGIDLDYFERHTRDEKLYEKLSDHGKRTVVIHVGRLERDKKIDLLVSIAEKMNPAKFHLLVVGNGKYHDRLETIQGVNALGFVPRDGVARYMATADLGILINDIEPFGLVGLEMMAVGLPMLAPKDGGLASFIKKDFAWLLPYTEQAYLKALATWRSLSGKKRQAMREAAHVAAQEYTIEKMTEKLLSYYATIRKQ